MTKVLLKLSSVFKYLASFQMFREDDNDSTTLMIYVCLICYKAKYIVMVWAIVLSTEMAMRGAKTQDKTNIVPTPFLYIIAFIGNWEV